MKKKITVLIIEDSAFMRRELRKIIDADPGLAVVGTARDGLEGLDMAKALEPDVVTIDLNLPEMDGLTCLQYIMIETPRPCVVISAYTGKDSVETFEALELGAVDFVQKPSGEISRDIHQKAASITARLKTAVHVNMSTMTRQAAGAKIAKKKERPESKKTPDKAVIIGVSTGGPRTLMRIIPALSERLIAPVVIVQHMPGKFTRSFAERLNDYSLLDVKEARNFDRLENGRVYVAPGDRNLVLVNDGGRPTVSIAIPENGDLYIPSVEKALDSAINVFEKRTIGVILTGMGNDGLNAMKRLHALDGITIAESEETAVIYGMPKEVIGHRAARHVAPAHEIAEIIEKAVARLGTDD
ncbi:MAG: chemotaxis-specific protein-glutamate methyltransferase CheB [Deltaproteobacteria bacterium]|nr:chemotaxis-specific protein-glutamate methyltransferase CheB [Deltaproteobacteria bacterium]MBW2047257.1 chemotaxis-specific protein-glutamate methyltransferase CheB [Deltaproteobacteria bacterium]MBW2095017.1 chemotaxis-specific protein-glutamate methyltransferase CheB [Deltaproteobacteria bacterium]